MKLKTSLLAATLAAFAATTAYANEEHHSGAKVETPTMEKAEVKKPMKKHNHMEEKMGIPMAAPATGAEKPESSLKADRHDHLKEKH